MREKLKAWKTVAEENPALVIGMCNTVAIAALCIVVHQSELNSRVAVRSSVIALKVALGEPLN